MKKNETENRRINLTAEREQKECEETFLRVVLSNEETEEADYWLKKARELAEDPDRSPTPEQRAAFQKRLSQEVKKVQSQKRRDAGNTASPRRAVRARHTPRRLAMAAIFLSAIMTTTLYCTVDAFAAGVDNFISTIFPRAQELRLTEGIGSDIDIDISNFAGMYFIDWVPEGFYVSEVESESFPKWVSYSDEEGKSICYYIYDDANSLRIDDEVVTEEEMYIHDSLGKIIVSNEDTYMIWEDGRYVYLISGPQSLREDLLKMMQKSIRVTLED